MTSTGRGMVYRTISDQIFIGMFFALYTANAIVSHAIGSEFVANARLMQQAGAGAVQLDERTLARGRGLLLINAPLFLELGWEVRRERPATGFFYWTSLVAGAAIIPFFVTMCAYLLFHPPRGGGWLPGIDPTDQSYKEEDDDDRR